MSVFLSEEQRKLLLAALKYYIKSAYTEEEIREQSCTVADEENTIEKRNELLQELKELVYIFK